MLRRIRSDALKVSSRASTSFNRRSQKSGPRTKWNKIKVSLLLTTIAATVIFGCVYPSFAENNISTPQQPTSLTPNQPAASTIYQESVSVTVTGASGDRSSAKGVSGLPTDQSNSSRLASNNSNVTMKTNSSKELKGISVTNQNTAPTDDTNYGPPEEYLLKVPFYIYEDFLHNDTLLNFTKIYHQSEEDGQKRWDTIVENETNVTFAEYLEGNRKWKHSGDIHFVRSALEHPMRVLDPKDAKLFVVPTLITQDIVNYFYSSREKRLTSRLQLKRINHFLSDSPWFKANDGADHIAPIAWFRGKDIIQKSVPLLARCNLVQFYESDGDPSYIHPDYRDKRAMYKIFYVGGDECNSIAFDKKSQDFAFIGALHRQKHGQNKHFQNRRDMCDWLSFTKHSYAVCGRGDACPNLAQALLGFHARGDTISASRLFNTIMSGTVPIFTLKPQYKSQPEWYDWDKISYFANVENNTEFLANLDKIMSNKTDIRVKTQNVLDNKDLFDWQTNVPFDVYMYHLQVKLYPETRVHVSSSKYSALILP